MERHELDHILIIGAGELGDAILRAFLAHAQRGLIKSLTLMLRQSSINSTDPSKNASISSWREQGIKIIPGDVDNDNQSHLTHVFSSYTTIIQATGMTAPPGTHLKITRATIAANVLLYLPWQFGIDYDVIGPEGGLGLFREAWEVRNLLRSQSQTQWLIISCGIFTSFLFEEFWGVVTRQGGTIKVTALNSWEDWITMTSAPDIGRCTVDVLLNDEGLRNRIVYIAGDTLTYGEFADTLERVTGQKILRDVWTLDFLRDEAKKDPENKLKQYRVVFSEGKGLSWPKQDTWNAKQGLELADVVSYIQKHLK